MGLLFAPFTMILSDSVIIPYSIILLPERIFALCTSLTNVVLPQNLTRIGYAAFYNCKSLIRITIPKSVKSIEERAFEKCSYLSSITVKPETPPTGGEYMFANTNIAPIYVPSGSVDSYKSAEYWRNYASRIQPIQ